MCSSDLAERNPEDVRAAVERLHADAWSITLDRIEDAVTPLRTLCFLPVDLVKIDQTAVAEANRDRLEALTATATTARRRGIATVATGIGTLPELAAAIAHGYDFAQGPLFGEQIPAPRIRGEATGPTQ